VKERFQRGSACWMCVPSKNKKRNEKTCEEMKEKKKISKAVSVERFHLLPVLLWRIWCSLLFPLTYGVAPPPVKPYMSNVIYSANKQICKLFLS
jgi:hypothetical protein